MFATGVQLSFSFLPLCIERTPEEARHTSAFFAPGRNSRHRAPWSLLEKPVLVITLLHERKLEVFFRELLFFAGHCRLLLLVKDAPSTSSFALDAPHPRFGWHRGLVARLPTPLSRRLLMHCGDYPTAVQTYLQGNTAGVNPPGRKLVVANLDGFK